jgi:hypothetical protein
MTAQLKMWRPLPPLQHYLIIPHNFVRFQSLLAASSSWFSNPFGLLIKVLIRPLWVNARVVLL